MSSTTVLHFLLKEVKKERICLHTSRLFPLTHFTLETPKGVLAKSADPDQMPHNVASDLGLHYFASCSTIFQQKYLN